MTRPTFPHSEVKSYSYVIEQIKQHEQTLAKNQVLQVVPPAPLVVPYVLLLYYHCKNWILFCKSLSMWGARVAQWVRSLDLTTHTSLSPIRRGFEPGFVNYKKRAIDSQPQVINLPVACPWSVVLSGYSDFLHH